MSAPSVSTPSGRQPSKGRYVYTDASSNPIDAMQCVDALLGPIQRGLENFGPVPSYRYDTGVSLASYEQLLCQYNELLETADRGMLALRLRAVKLEIENRKLRAEIASRSR